MKSEYDAARAAAAKCTTRTEFCARFSSLYQLSRRNNWLDDFLPKYVRRKPTKVQLKQRVRLYLARAQPVIFEDGKAVYELGYTKDTLAARFGTLHDVTGQQFQEMRCYETSAPAARAAVKSCRWFGTVPHTMVFEGRQVPTGVLLFSEADLKRVFLIMEAFAYA